MVTGDSVVGGLVGYNERGGLADCCGSVEVTGEGDRIGGLLGYSENGTVSDSHSGGDVTGGYCVGGLIGEQETGSVLNCSSTGAVSGHHDVGGLLGVNGGSVVNSYSAGGVTGTGSDVGGLIGFGGGSVSNCHSIGSVTGQERYVGGLIGTSCAGVTNCYSTGAVTGGKYSWYVGGFIGENSYNVFGCYCTGAVAGFTRVGGFVGRNRGGSGSSGRPGWPTTDWGILDRCFSSGQVVASSYVGGFVGENHSGCLSGCYSNGAVTSDCSPVGGLLGDGRYGRITDCYSIASVAGQGNVVGGLIGNVFDGTVSSCYSAGRVRVTGGGFPCGMIGHNYNSTVVSCFWDRRSSGASSDGGSGSAGLPTVQMQDINTYLEAGWDFVGETENGVEDIWCIEDGQGYPYLPSAGVIFGPMQLYSGGSGTADDPFLIATAWDLIALGHTEPDYDKHFLMVADIDLSGHTFDRAVIAWDANALTPDFEGTPFTGTFVGDNHVIRNLHIEGEGCLGLFGRLAGSAVVEGVVLESCAIEGQTGTIGGLAGESFGSVSQSCVAGDVTGENRLGGLIGVNRGSISCCCTDGDVAGRDVVGGLVGYNGSDARIANGYSTAAVAGKTGVGGLLGYNDASDGVSMCFSTGAVTGENSVGGLIGHDDRGKAGSGFWDIETSGIATSAGGVGLTTAQMQDVDTYPTAEWDFVGEAENGVEDIWWIGDGDYPRLWWEVADGD